MNRNRRHSSHSTEKAASRKKSPDGGISYCKVEGRLHAIPLEYFLELAPVRIH